MPTPTNNRRGLVPIKRTGANSDFRKSKYKVSANNPDTLFPGDPVVNIPGQKLRRIKVSGISAGVPGVLGVIGAVYNSNGRPFTHAAPASPNAIPVSSVGFAEVYDDPDILFLAQADSALNVGDVGKFVRVTAASANTAAGISGFQIKVVDATTGNVAGHQFQIVAIGPNETIGDITLSNSFNQANNDVVVRISDHAYRRQNRVLGTIASGAAD